jgi:hypothetical protein
MSRVSGEPPTCAPERAYQERLTRDNSKVSGNGMLTLTATDVSFDGKIGENLVVSLGDFVGAHDEPARD